MENSKDVQPLQGMGRLIDTEGKQITAYVLYNIQWKPATEQTPEEWSGYFNANRPVSVNSTYILEFEDGRKGNCTVSDAILPTGGLDTVNSYNLHGNGPIT